MSAQPKFEDAAINTSLPRYGCIIESIRESGKDSPLLKVFSLSTVFTSTAFINAFLEKKWPGIFGLPFKIKLPALLDGKIGPLAGGLHNIIDPGNKSQER